LNYPKPCLLLSDAASRLDCEIKDILDWYIEDEGEEISIYVIPPADSYIWLNDGSAPVTASISDGVLLLDDDVKEIIGHGKMNINWTQSGYLSRNQKFRFSKVTVTYPQLAISEDDFFHISNPRSIKPQNTIETRREIEFLQNKAYPSDQLRILNDASEIFWGNADPKQKDTQPINDTVIKWLMDREFSQISAQQGASIIRPAWAAQGRRKAD
jgi:hypothetical protein